MAVQVARRYQDIEDILTTYKVPGFEYVELPTNQVDQERSLQNQARFEPINESVKAEYAAAWENGATFPPIVVYRPRSAKKYTIVDGNHRFFSALDVGVEKVPAICLPGTTRPQVVTILTYVFNTKHGLPSSEQERIQQAFYLLDSDATLENAATALNLPLATLRREVNKRNTLNRGVEAGIPERKWSSIPAATRGRLAKIRTDEALVDATQLVLDARLGPDDVLKLVTNVNSSKNAAKQREAVKAARLEYSDKIQSTAGGILGGASNRRGLSPRTTYGRVMGQLSTLPGDPSVIVKSFSRPELDDEINRVQGAIDRLITLRDAMEDAR